MDIVRNPDGTLVVPVEPGRTHDDDADTASDDGDAVEVSEQRRPRASCTPAKAATTKR